MKNTVPNVGAEKEQMLNIRDFEVLCFGKKSVRGGDLL